jgi:hypothetical protein
MVNGAKKKEAKYRTEVNEWNESIQHEINTLTGKNK